MPEFTKMTSEERAHLADRYFCEAFRCPECGNAENAYTAGWCERCQRITDQERLTQQEGKA